MTSASSGSLDDEALGDFDPVQAAEVKGSVERAELLRQLSKEIAHRRERGEWPTLGEYRERYPGLSQELNALFHRPSDLESLDRDPERPQPPLHEFEPQGIPRQLGDHHIFRFVAEGGMGYVYEAEQVSMGRCVALKVLKPEILSPNTLVRFRRESHAAGLLHHTNIVPVFGNGECAGFHYYTMQFIRGEGLDKVIAGLRRLRDSEPVPRPRPPATTLAVELSRSLCRDQFDRVESIADRPMSVVDVRRSQPDWPGPKVGRSQADPRAAPPASIRSSLPGPSCRPYFKSIARIVAQAADALDYAHQHGIQHRDIKPSNLLLDRNGSIWLSDFGLARDEEAEDITGRYILGTLRYMAPERFEGVSKPQGDIYSLGLTLYELATLEPAFQEHDPTRLVHQIRIESPRPPRELDPTIPRDLETIILKAIKREPASRYSTSGKLARDLNAFLEHREIEARRDRWYEKAGRWCRRNPAVATLSALAISLVLTVAVVSSIMSVRLGRALEASKKAGNSLTIQIRKEKESLFTANLAAARASRFSRRVGQRFASLDALRKAVSLARDLRMPAKTFDELRTEVIASLAVVDIGRVEGWHFRPDADHRYYFDSALRRTACHLDYEGAICVRDVGSGREIARLQGFPSRLSLQLRLSPDGKFLATWSSSGRIKVWRVSEERTHLLIDAAADLGWAGAEKDQFDLFSPDSRQLAISHRDGTIRIYDLETGLVARTLPVGAHCTRYVFHPNGRQIAVAQASQVQVWDLETCQATDAFKFGGAVHLAWDPDGRVVATASNNEISLWNAHTGTVIHRSPLSHRGGGILLAFDPSGEILYSGSYWSGTSRLWHVQTGRLLLSDLRFYWPDLFQTTGHLHTTSFYELWQVATGREYRTLARTQDESQFPTVHPGGRLLAVGMTDGVSLWDLDHGVELSPIRIGQVRKPSFGASGDLLAYGDSGLLRGRVETDADGKIRVGPFEMLASSTFQQHDLWSAEDPKAQVVVRANYDGAIVLRRDRPKQKLWLGPHHNCRYVAISPDGRWIATGAHEGHAIIWDTETGRRVTELGRSSSGRVVFSPDNRWLASGGFFWAVGTWKRGPRFGGDGVSFSPDSKMFAAGELAFIRLIEVETGRELARLEDPNQERTDYSAFSAEGARLVTTNNESGSIHVWDLRSIRRQLEEFGLDWDAPSLPRPISEAPVAPLQMTVDRGVLDRPTFAKDEPAENIIRKGTEWLIKYPDDGEMRHQRGHALLEVRRYREAFEDFDAAFRAASDDPHLLAFRGVARFAVGQLDEAIADLEASLKTRPDQPGMPEQLARACNQRARILSLGPEPRRDPARALTLARRALELEPDKPPYFQTIGIALYRAGQHADAITFLERSLATGAGRLEALDLLFLAMARHGLGQAEQAVADFDRAVRWIQANPPPSMAQTQAMANLRAEAEAALRRPILTLPTDVFAPVPSEIRP